MPRSVLLLMILIYSATIYAQSISSESTKKLTGKLRHNGADSTHIDSLLKLAKYHVFKPGENKIDLDSAAGYIAKAEDINSHTKSDWATGYSLLIKSYWLKESGQRDTARASVEQAVSLLQNEPDKNLLGDALMELAGYYDYNDNTALTKRIELVTAAVNSYEHADNIQQKAASLQMLGDLCNINGNSYLALQYLHASLEAYNSIHYPQVQGIHCLIGYIYARLREYPEALKQELLALKTAEATGDSSMQLCQIYNYLGEIHRDMGDKEKAIEHYQKALEVARRHHDIFAIYLATTNIAETWTLLKKPGKALDMMKTISALYEKPKSLGIDYNIAKCYINSYSQLKQFENARPYVNQLLQMITKFDLNHYASISIYAIVIRYHIDAGEYGNARSYLEKHDEIAMQLGDFLHLASNQKLRFMLDTSRHDYKAAILHLLEFNRLSDSLFNETKSNQMAELQVQFETEKKEIAIASKDKDIQLLTKQNQLQDSKIEKGRLTRNFMIAGAALLLLILALVYRGYRIKQKNNNILSQQRLQINDQNRSLQTMVHEQDKLIGEKEWLLKEIHHRVKNNLQIVMSLLNSQTAYIDNQIARNAINDSQHRVHAMSLLHQKLYNAENISAVDISLYARELVSYLADSFNTSQQILFRFDIEPIEMDISQAVPLGLILNEAITNAIKYAFPENRSGVISIALVHTDGQNYELRIADDGIGIPSHFNNKKSGSLGMSLMAGLSEDLDGHFSIENHHGTLIKISFVLDSDIKRTGIPTSSHASHIS